MLSVSILRRSMLRCLHNDMTSHETTVRLVRKIPRICYVFRRYMSLKGGLL